MVVLFLVGSSSGCALSGGRQWWSCSLWWVVAVVVLFLVGSSGAHALPGVQHWSCSSWWAAVVVVLFLVGYWLQKDLADFHFFHAAPSRVLLSFFVMGVQSCSTALSFQVVYRALYHCAEGA